MDKVPVCKYCGFKGHGMLPHQCTTKALKQTIDKLRRPDMDLIMAERVLSGDCSRVKLGKDDTDGGTLFVTIKHSDHNYFFERFKGSNDELRFGNLVIKRWSVVNLHLDYNLVEILTDDWTNQKQ